MTDTRYLFRPPKDPWCQNNDTSAGIYPMKNQTSRHIHVQMYFLLQQQKNKEILNHYVETLAKNHYKLTIK